MPPRNSESIDDYTSPARKPAECDLVDGDELDAAASAPVAGKSPRPEQRPAVPAAAGVPAATVSQSSTQPAATFKTAADFRGRLRLCLAELVVKGPFGIAVERLSDDDLMRISKISEDPTGNTWIAVIDQACPELKDALVSIFTADTGQRQVLAQRFKERAQQLGMTVTERRA